MTVNDYTEEKKLSFSLITHMEDIASSQQQQQMIDDNPL